MTWLQTPRSRYAAVAVGSALLGFLVAWPLFAAGQDKKDPPSDPAAKHVHPADKPADQSKDLADQVKLLQAKVARLEAAVAKIAPPAGGMAGMGGMGMDDMMGMGGMKGGGMPGMSGMSGMGMDKMMGMGGMSGSGGGMMMMDDMNMMGMGPMGGQKGMKMKMTAALPGFPGASHIYHIGATDFFLDHPEHITLTNDQQVRLNAIKQKAVTEKANAQRKIEEAEQQLWELTAADQPDAGKIDAKVKEIEKLRGDQRLTFIRSVGEAAQVLTDDQRKSLLGHAPATPSPHVHPKTP
jgi:Spy/CpxP family protein refolding chaperone